jgi:hypothetical protein
MDHKTNLAKITTGNLQLIMDLDTSIYPHVWSVIAPWEPFHSWEHIKPVEVDHAIDTSTTRSLSFNEVELH